MKHSFEFSLNDAKIKATVFFGKKTDFSGSLTV